MKAGTPRSRKRVTCMDVAQLAGVTIGSVSRVLNGAANVTPQVREKVMRAADMLNYRPSAAARMLARQRHETVGLVFEREHVTTLYGAQLMEGICGALTENGLRLATGMVQWKSRVEQVEELPMIRTASVDGLVLDIAQIEGDVDAMAGRLRIPYVLINPSGSRPYNRISPNDEPVAVQATTYLIERGHRRIAYIPCPINVTHSSQADRMNGYAGAMQRAGLPPIPMWDKPLTRKVGGDGEEDDYIVRMRIFHREHRCTAVVCYSYVEAIRMLYSCFQLGLKVPEDVSLIACDHAPQPDITPVPITCFHLDRYEMGRLAVKMLLQRIEENGAAVPSITYDGTFVAGDSVATVRESVEDQS